MNTGKADIAIIEELLGILNKGKTTKIEAKLPPLKFSAYKVTDRQIRIDIVEEK